MDEVFSQSKKFFSLPMEEKMKLLRNEKNRGYTPVLMNIWTPSIRYMVCAVTGDYKEGYYIGIEVSEDDPDSQKPFCGPNMWPCVVLWMAKRYLADMEGNYGEYHQEALEVARKVSRLIALALELNFDYFDHPAMLGKPIATLRLLHYEGIINASGCELFHLIVNISFRAFVVNLGDMLERWSNDIFRSTLHRVLVNGQERYSIAFFVEPNHDCIVGCLPTCQSENNPPKFPPIKCLDYLLQRYKDTHADLNSYK
ncbi:UNVERIFIED_CONTAM: 2-oxoglutarate-Fe(II) type oxidoreductase hxnY [Sesamum latifolium]|uniref:2-oxoglutarate-Fe(II) type oxidoreductase hxnY n=1 Tax=Sesamum latifolium TaxID=2727402 RepID=A0AAW2VC26_9LAMI